MALPRASPAAATPTPTWRPRLPAPRSLADLTRRSTSGTRGRSTPGGLRRCFGGLPGAAQSLERGSFGIVYGVGVVSESLFCRQHCGQPAADPPKLHGIGSRLGDHIGRTPTTQRSSHRQLPPRPPCDHTYGGWGSPRLGATSTGIGRASANLGPAFNQTRSDSEGFQAGVDQRGATWCVSRAPMCVDT